jgi:hypothetical protein
MGKKRRDNSPSRRKFTASTLPLPGTTYAIELEDGIYGACTALAIRRPDQSLPRFLRYFGVFVAAFDWMGSRAPQLADLKLSTLLHSDSNNVQGIWIAEPPPATWKAIGVISLPSEVTISSEAISGWGWIESVLNDHLQALREFGSFPSASAKGDPSEIEPQGTSKNEDKSSGRRELTLENVNRERYFEEWRACHRAHIVNEAERIIHHAVRDLAAVREQESENKKIGILRKYIEGFNELDEKHHFIDSIERDDILECFYQLVRDCHLSNAQEMADEWRSW